MKKKFLFLICLKIHKDFWSDQLKIKTCSWFAFWRITESSSAQCQRRINSVLSAKIVDGLKSEERHLNFHNSHPSPYNPSIWKLKPFFQQESDQLSAKIYSFKALSMIPFHLWRISNKKNWQTFKAECRNIETEKSFSSENIFQHQTGKISSKLSSQNPSRQRIKKIWTNRLREKSPSDSQFLLTSSKCQSHPDSSLLSSQSSVPAQRKVASNKLNFLPHD